MSPTSPAPASPGPYGQAARDYYDAGWSPLPVRGKHPPPDGWTGHVAPYPSYPDVDAWAEDQPSLNVGLRMSPRVIGVDVDAYGDKRGAATLAECEARWGRLPATVKSTSRDDGVSGIRFYRIPEGLAWPGQLPGGGVELIHKGHRYAMAWPSVHPDTRRVYRWFDADGAVMLGIPNAADVAALPQPWLDGLSRGAHRALPAGTFDEGWLDDVAQGGLCGEMSSALHRHLAVMVSGSRHEAMNAGAWELLRLADEGHAGVVDALGRLRDAFLAAVAVDGSRTDATAVAEWGRSLHDGIAKCIGTPARRYGLDPCIMPTLVAPNTAPVPLTPSPDVRQAGDWVRFWGTEELAIIHGWARHLRAGPLATLVVSLLRVLGTIPPWVTLPPLVGGRGSLNAFAGLVSPSGVGKEAVFSASVAALDVGTPAKGMLFESGDDEWPPRITPGSGEGIAHMFVRMVAETTDEPGRDGQPKKTGRVVQEQYRSSVLFEVDEVDTLTALTSRAGSTLDSVLRALFTAARLGHGYVDKEKRLLVGAHTYRAGLVVAIQPGSAAALFDKASGGTPQRFLFVDAADRDAPDGRPDAPPRKLTLAAQDWGWHPVTLHVPAEAAHEVDATRWRYLRGEGLDPLGSHRMFTRLKLSQALAVLAGRRDMTLDDWWRAGVLIGESVRVTASVAAHRRAETVKRNVAAGQSDAERETAKRAVVEGADRERVAALLAKYLGGLTPGDTFTPAKLFNARFQRFGRDVFVDVFDEAVKAGRVIIVEGSKAYTVPDVSQIRK